MSETFTLEVISPISVLANLEVEGATVPAFDGERGFLSGHELFVGQLGFGPLTYTAAGGAKQMLYVGFGFYRFDGSTLTVVCSEGLKPEDIDLAAEEALLKRLDSALANSSLEEIDSEVHGLGVESFQRQVCRGKIEAKRYQLSA